MDRLIEALNSMPGITTGYVDESPEGWSVSLDPDREEDGRPAPAAWHHLTMLAWTAHAWSTVSLSMTALPPWANEQPQRWWLSGTIDPDEYAAIVDRATTAHLEADLVYGTEEE